MDVATFLVLLRTPEVRLALREALSGPQETTNATIAQFAERHAVSRSTVERWLTQGLPSYKHGKVRRIPVAQGDAWLRDGHGGIVQPMKRIYRRRQA